ncbi:hypothetical protein [Lysinibacillus sp. NPDC059133]|uniref:hypothetical protein n=1 Tax=Lysinibacillus sp. NPDC059133 TaxID=3346737 RepID=UPI0036948840
MNYEKLSPEADGEMDGMIYTNERVRGNNKSKQHLYFLVGTTMYILNTLYIIILKVRRRTVRLVQDGRQANYSDHVELISGNIQRLTSDGSRLMYSRNIDCTFTAPPGRFESITQHNDGTITISKKNLEQWKFNDKGQIISKLNSNGNGVIQENLVRFTDTNGIAMSVSYGEFMYEDAKYLTKIEFADKRSISYGYSSTFFSSVIDNEDD